MHKLLVLVLACALLVSCARFKSADPSAPTVAPDTVSIVSKRLVQTDESASAYIISSDVPASCTIVSVERFVNGEYEPAPINMFVAASTPGSILSMFIGPGGEYKIASTCAPTCGNGVCDNTDGSFGEKALPPNNTNSACPQDCGCGDGLAYGIVNGAYACVPPCETLTVTLDQEIFVQQQCTPQTSPGGAVNETHGCQKQVDASLLCVHCLPGVYMDAQGSCTKVHYSDGICAGAHGEPATSSDCIGAT